jgi:hypothetical protein
MSSSGQAVVALCAAAGFLIVWLVLPAKGARTSPRAHDTASPRNSSSRPKDEPEPKGATEDLSGHSTNLGGRPRWCDILLLEPDASPDAIRKAYARLMKGLHPDVAGADEYTTQQCALVQDAYRQAMRDRR